MRTLRTILATFLLASAVGCASFNVAKNTASFAHASGGLSEDLTALMGEILAVLPESTGEPKAHLQTAQSLVKAAQSNAKAMVDDNDKLTKAYAKVKAHDDKWSASFFSERQVRDFWILVIGGVLCAVACGVWYALTGLSAGSGVLKLVGAVLKGVGHLASAGTTLWAGKLKAWLQAKVKPAPTPHPKPTVTINSPPVISPTPV